MVCWILSLLQETISSTRRIDHRVSTLCVRLYVCGSCCRALAEELPREQAPASWWDVEADVGLLVGMNNDGPHNCGCQHCVLLYVCVLMLQGTS